MNELLKVFKVNAVPATLVADAIYIVADGTDPELAEIYISDATGSASRALLTKAATQALIDTAISGLSENVVVATFPALPAANSVGSELYFVADASGDPTVDTGGARYRSDGTNWIKFGEDESMDIDFSAISIAWSQLTGGPASTPAQIDSAVNNSHSHANLTELNKLGEDANGLATYGGSLIRATWNEGATPAW